jgi:hypothetical protein
MLEGFFDISTGFRFSKLHFGSVPSIPVAVLGLGNRAILVKKKVWADYEQLLRPVFYVFMGKK